MVPYKHLIVVKVKKSVYLQSTNFYKPKKKNYLKLVQPIDRQYLTRIINPLLFITATTKRSK